VKSCARIRSVTPVTTTQPLSVVLARNIRAERGRRLWKQEELADLLGWGRSTVGAVETGKRSVGIDDLPVLCRVFDIPLIKLFEGADPAALRALGIT
jgi:transcriptional regulator with XRE-family HTH domain